MLDWNSGGGRSREQGAAQGRPVKAKISLNIFLKMLKLFQQAI